MRTPCAQRAIGEQHCGVGIGIPDPAHGLGQTQDNRRPAVPRGEVAQLPIPVSTTGSDLSIGLDDKRGIETRLKRGHTGKSGDRNRQRAILVGAVTELAARILAPGINRSIRAHRQSVVTTSRDRLDSAE